MPYLRGISAVILAGLTWVATAQGNEVKIRIEGDNRIIESNGIPDHPTGSFPNRRNPNRISAQKYTFRVPANPRIAATITPHWMGPFGIALNGIPFDPAAAEWWNRDQSSGWQYEAIGGAVSLGIDQNNAHVQPTGAYHYHGIPAALITTGTKATKPVLVGYAGDGFPIYGPFGYKDAQSSESAIVQLHSSYRIKNGTRPNGPGGKYDGSFTADYEYVAGLGDLDECNGRSGFTPEYPNGTYYYVLTDEFPFIPRCFKGTPERSFVRPPRRDGRGMPPGGRMRGPGGTHGPGPGGPQGPGSADISGPGDGMEPDARGASGPGAESGTGSPPGGFMPRGQRGGMLPHPIDGSGGASPNGMQPPPGGPPPGNEIGASNNGMDDEGVFTTRHRPPGPPVDAPSAFPNGEPGKPQGQP